MKKVATTNKWQILIEKLNFSNLSLSGKNREQIDEIIVILSISILGLLLRIPYITSHNPNNDGHMYLTNAKDLYNLRFPSERFFFPGFSLLSIPFIPFFGDQACNATSFFFSILSIPMTFKLTAKYYNNYAGYFSALFFAITPLHIFWSGRDYADVTSLFWIMLTLYYHFSKDYNKSACLFAFTIFVRLPNVLLFPFLLFSSNNHKTYLKYLPLFFLAVSFDLISRYFWSLTRPTSPITTDVFWRNLDWSKNGFIGWSVPFGGGAMWDNYFITPLFLLALFLMPKEEEMKMILLWFTPFFVFHLFWHYFSVRFLFPILPLFCIIGSKSFKMLLEIPEYA